MQESLGVDDYSDEQLLAEQTYQRIKEVNAYLTTISSQEMSRKEYYSIRSELNSMYPYINRIIYAKGCGVFPVFDSDGSHLGDQWAMIEGEEGVHEGFNLVQRNQDDHRSLAVMHQIGIRESAEPKFLTASINYHFYLDVEQSNVILSDELYKIFYGKGSPETDAQLSLENFDLASVRVDRLLRSTSFRNKDYEKQTELLRSVIDEEEIKIGLRGKRILAEAEYGLLPNLGETNLIFSPVDLSSFTIGGTCLALEPMESFSLRNRANHRDIGLIDDSSELCLVIDPDEDTRRGIQLSSRQVLYIPTRQHIQFEQI